jgi:alpha-L-fucosidase
MKEKEGAMGKSLVLLLLCPLWWGSLLAQGNDLDRGQVDYVPSRENLDNREWFRNAHFGMFIHWGVSSVLGKEIGWALSNQDVKEYRKNLQLFNPVRFDAATVVKLAKDSGMRYITFTTRHHDSFSMFQTRYSDWSIMQTPYRQDVLKLLAEECRQQGIRLFLYYSLTDFYRPDYCQGNVEKGRGIPGDCDWPSYLQFMKNQLTELLTRYGKVYGIWFDGHWDQVFRQEGKNGKQRRAWHYDEIYKLIHDLQPGCMIVNNHHLTPFPGEDYQTFERDLPGENSGGGYSADAGVAENLPLETSDIIGKSWGYVKGDDRNRSARELIHLLVRASGNGANLLLNIGPTPEGEVRPEHKERLLAMGQWLQRYGETIYETRKGYMKPAPWGTVLEKRDTVYVHILDGKSLTGKLEFPSCPYKVQSVVGYANGRKIPFHYAPSGSRLILDLSGGALDPSAIDNVLEMRLKKIS